jgi:hypothetical protein
MVGPQSDHLASLASLIYDEVKPHAGNDDVLLESNKFKLVDQQNIKQTIRLDNNTDIKNLLMMTPYYWHIPLAKQNVFSEINELETVGSFRISVYRKS